MPSNFAISSTNLLMIANGINKVLRWDGLYGQMEDAGVNPPLVAPTLSFSGVGSITGSYMAYVRFVDRLGNFSDLTPIGVAVSAAAKSTVTYSGLPVPQQPSVVRRQILRNTAGQLVTFYIDIDTTDLGSTSLTSTKTDPQLAVLDFQALFDSEGKDLANVHGVPPSWKPFIVQHLARIYMAGEIVYGEGAAILSFGSTSVTGIGTEWPATFAGRFFYGAGAEKAIEIASVDVANQVLTLLSPWTGSTLPYQTYWIRPAPAEKNLLYFSQPGQPESFPGVNAVSLPEDGMAVTGLMNMSSFVYILKQRLIYRLTAQQDPATDGYIFLAANRGCVNNRCYVVVGDTAWLMDDQGIYEFTGGEATDISQGIQGIFRRTNRFYGLNWNASRFWHAVNDTNFGVIRWFVSLSGDYMPRHALCYQYSLKRWWIEEYPVPIGASAIGRSPPTDGSWRIAGQDVLYFGSRAAKVYAYGGSRLDGPDPDSGSTHGAVASASRFGLTAAFGSFAASGLVGSPVSIVSGRGEGQTRRIAAVSGLTVTITQPWTVRPDSTSVFVLGGIPWAWRSGRITYTQGEARTTRSVLLGYRPVPSGDIPSEAVAQIYDDYSNTPRVSLFRYTKSQRRGVSTEVSDSKQRVDLTRLFGMAEIGLSAQREGSTDAPMKISIGFSGVARENTVTIKSIGLEGVKGDKGN